MQAVHSLSEDAADHHGRFVSLSATRTYDPGPEIQRAPTACTGFRSRDASRRLRIERRLADV